MKEKMKKSSKFIIGIVLALALIIQPLAGIKAEAATVVKLESLNVLSGENYKKNVDPARGGDHECHTEYKDAKYSEFLFFDAGLTKETARRNKCYVTYDLGGNYTLFDCVVSTGTRTGSGVYDVYFYGDGRLLKAGKYDAVAKKINDDDKYERLDDIDVKGVKTLKIQVVWHSGTSSDGYIYLVEGKLTKASNSSSGSSSDSGSSSSDSGTGTKYNTSDLAEETNTSVKLSKIKKPSFNRVSVVNSVTTPSGKTYKYDKNIVKFDASLTDCNAVYNLAGKYNKITGKLVGSRENGNSKVDVRIYGDGKLLKSYLNITRDKTVNVSVNISKVKKLKITAYNKGDYADGYVFFVNPLLSGGDLKLSKTKAIIGIGDKINLTARYKNKKIATTKLSWSTTDAKVAKVSSKGLIVGKGGGVCKVTATYGKESKSVLVFVKPGKVQDLKISSKGTDFVQFSWKGQTNVTGYVIYQYDDDLEEYSLVKKVSNNAYKGLKIVSLEAGTDYSYKIAGYVTVDNKDYVGQLSDALSFTTYK